MSLDPKETKNLLQIKNLNPFINLKQHLKDKQNQNLKVKQFAANHRIGTQKVIQAP